MKLERINTWTPEAEAGLEKALGQYPEAIKCGVGAGVMELWRINDGESWMVTELRGDRLLIWCYQGARLRELLPALQRVASRNGCRGVRCWTRRPGLVRWALEFGGRVLGRDDDGLYVCEVPTA